jgi:hypothetical protein
MHRSHTLYSADPQRYTMPDSIAPSGRWNRSLTKTVLRIRTARRVLTKSPFLINFFIMMRLTFGALSLGSCCTQASAKVLADGRILSHGTPYFCGQEQIPGLSSVRLRSTSTSARSFRRQPEWPLTLASLTMPDHRRSSNKSW